MKTVLVLETTRPIGARELNGFLSGLSAQMPGCFVSQGPSTAGRLTVTVLSSTPVELEVAEQVLESLPQLCDAISSLELQQPVSRFAAARAAAAAAAAAG